MKSVIEIIKDNKFVSLPLGSKFSCTFKDWKATKSGNGVLMQFNATDIKSGKTYQGVMWLANNSAQNEEFDRDEVFIIETEDELNADGYVVINMVD
jgi:hypothetical protein